mgnify:CR=1 FL=1
MTFSSSNRPALTPSIYHYLDFILLKNKKSILLVSENEYIQLIGAVAPILNDSRVLLVENADISLDFVKGYGSINEKLNHKFSYILSTNFSSVILFVLCETQTYAQYSQVLSNVDIDKKTDYQLMISSLEEAEYERVDHVDGIKQFCVKGGIIDFYSPLYSRPVRACLYEEDRSLNFYNIVTGVSEEELQVVSLNKQEKKVKQFNIRNWCIDNQIPVLPSLKSVAKKIRPLDYYQLKESQSSLSIEYVSEVYFAAYKYKDKIIAPLSYKKEPEGRFVNSEHIFEVGDYVCHEDFGVGVLRGFIVQHSNYQEESVQIEYMDGKILLGVSGLHKLSIVSRETAITPKVGFLSKQGVWHKTKKRVSESIEGHVQEIIQLYEKKRDTYREPLRFGGSLEDDFIKEFQYIDTPDQRRAWEDIKEDLEQERPMYRLLCGDVGFGKTEIAMRMAFRVVLNGGKVVVLVPTSILAAQHYKVFCDRMKSFGVNVSVLTRFLSGKEKSSLKVSWLGGEQDILIGTSAVLYDVDFIRVASAFIVDEEHRFGVKDKEVLINKFSNKDILYMSATPIPRSLNLSLTGIHSISTLASPPVLRLPIQTFVVFFDQKMIKRAIDFELSRGGQVFYLHNDIASINVVYHNLKRLYPYLSVVVAHSKVPSASLKRRVLRFVNGKIDLLLCTSIIGSGIDIPNANTILINNAHLFGLGQLHQIRGRVGRGKRQAFAYLMLPKKGGVTSRGEKRLKTISEQTGLGAGYYIAKSDMQIRGGGLLFGYKQSGDFFKFGYEYYSKLVAQKIEEIKKEDFIYFVDKFVYNVAFPCVIPEKYIISKTHRLTAYHRLGLLYEIKGVNLYNKNIRGVYGPPPSSFQNLIDMRVVSLYAGLLKLISLKNKKNSLVLVFDNKFQETSVLLKLLKNKALDKSVDEYFFKTLKDATSLELIINKGVILEGSYIKFLLERLYGYVKK